MLYHDHIKFRFIYKQLVLLFLITIFHAAAHGQTATTKSKRLELEKQRKLLEKQIAQTRSILNLNKKQQQISLSALTAINSQIRLRENVIDNIGQQIFEISLEIQKQRFVIEQLVLDINNIKAEYARNIVSSYKLKSSTDKLVFIFNAKDFNQAFKRIQYLNQYNKYRQQQARLILKTQQQIVNEINEMIAIKREKMNLIGMKESEKKLLETDKSEKQQVLNNLQQNEKQMKAQLALKEKAAEKLSLAIKELITKEIAEAKKAEEARRKKMMAKEKSGAVKSSENTSAAAMTPDMLKLSSDFESNRGKLPWPVENGVISETFGMHSHPTLKGIKTFNNGINISAPKGSVARTIYKGTVKAIFSVPGMERVVLVNHGEYYSVYANLEAINVKTGQEVKTGEILGTLYTNDELDRTEVHLEVFKQKTMQNPALWLRN